MAELGGMQAASLVFSRAKLTLALRRAFFLRRGPRLRRVVGSPWPKVLDEEKLSLAREGGDFIAY